MDSSGEEERVSAVRARFGSRSPPQNKQVLIWPRFPHDQYETKPALCCAYMPAVVSLGVRGGEVQGLMQEVPPGVGEIKSTH